MSHEKLYEEATKVAAQGENDGPDGASSTQPTGLSQATMPNGAVSFAEMMTARSDRFGGESDELAYAFYGLASIINSSILSGLSFNADTLADEYEKLAVIAGADLARENGGPASPNRHLQLLAETTRQSGRLRTSAAALGGTVEPDARAASETQNQTSQSVSSAEPEL